MANDLPHRPSLCLIEALGSPPSIQPDLLTRARSSADKIPLVRVVVPSEGHPRHDEEWRDVLGRGLLRVAHKSTRSRDVEKELLAPDSLYFHAGRAHPDYGTLVLILEDSSAGVCEASASGLGSLLCARGSAMADTVAHGCLAPVSHWDLGEQQRFYTQTTWQGAWREKAAHFLAGYYGQKGLDGYFGEGEDARPNVADPSGVFHNPTITDWRAWTIEVRHTRDLDLNVALDQGRILGWALHPDLRNLIETRLKAGDPPLAFYHRLRTDLRDRELPYDKDAETATLAADRFCRNRIGEWR